MATRSEFMNGLVKDNDLIPSEDLFELKRGNKSIWIISVIVLGGLLLISFFTSNFGINEVTGGTTKESIESKVRDFIYTLVPSDVDVKILDIKEENGMYKVAVFVDNEEMSVYISKDSELIFLNTFELDSGKELEKSLIN